MEKFEDDIQKQVQAEIDTMKADTESIISAANEKKSTTRAEISALNEFGEIIQPLKLQLQQMEQQLQLLAAQEERQQAEAAHETRLPVSLQMAQKLREQLSSTESEEEQALIKAKIAKLEGDVSNQPDSYKQHVEVEAERISLQQRQATLQVKYEEAVRAFTERHGIEPNELHHSNV